MYTARRSHGSPPPPVADELEAEMSQRDQRQKIDRLRFTLTPVAGDKNETR
jgi:hypothetical protein